MSEPNDLSILVVEDEEALRKAIVFDFKRKGFQTFEADNGKHALRILQTQKLDVILSDIQMPNGNGLELLDQIKVLSPQMPVVMLISGFADTNLNEAYQRGAEAVLSKPFDRKTLIKAVLRSVLPRKMGEAQRKAIRVVVDLDVRIRFPDFNSSILGKVLNISSNGIFVALKDRLPTIDAAAVFQIQSAQSHTKEITGTGVVRWVRGQTSSNWPAGCGIEFDQMSDLSRDEIVQLIQSQLSLQS